MTQYLISVIHPENYITAPAEMEKVTRQVDVLNGELQAAGAWVFAGGLHPSSSATTLRAQDGVVVTTDGPFAETAEQVGGFWVIEAADLDAALDWGRKATIACAATIEVRPFQDNAVDPGEPTR